MGTVAILRLVKETLPPNPQKLCCRCLPCLVEMGSERGFEKTRPDIKGQAGDFSDCFLEWPLCTGSQRSPEKEIALKRNI